MRFTTTLLTLLSHWKRHRFQLVTLVTGLAVATALWSGVQALNAQAKQSYAEAASQSALAALPRLTAPAGVPLADYITLRRAGWLVSPVVERPIDTGSGTIRLLGIDPLTLPPGLAPAEIGDSAADGFFAPPYRLLANPADAAALTGPDLPPVTADPAIPKGTALTDIAAIAPATGDLSFLVILPGQPNELPPLASLTSLDLSEPQSEVDLARLTESFHLNLTAFGFLAFVVGLFIVHATIGLAFEQRRPIFRTMRACGSSTRDLTIALLAELLALALISGTIGMILGYLIAAALIGDVAASLRGLYGAEIPGTLSLRPTWWLAGLAMTVAGALAAALSGLWRLHRLPVLDAARPDAWARRQSRLLAAQSAAALALFAAALIALSADSLPAGFAIMGGLMLGGALLLPALLNLVLSLFARKASAPLTRWFWADSRQQISGLSLALMALLLALAVNIGVGTMVSSFRDTFTSWLDQRLLADLYAIGADADETEAMTRWLETRPEVEAVLPVWHIDTRLGDWPVEVYGVKDYSGYRSHWPILQGTETPWDTLHAGTGALVSEQLARHLSLVPGDRVTIDGQSFEVSATYSDYGNPIGQIVISNAALIAHWPGVERLRIGAVVTGELAPLRAALAEAFALPPARHYTVASVKANALAVFERTFAVTTALNILTFLVAGIALLTGLLTLSTMRLPQLAPLWAMGVTRRQLARIELARALMLALLTSLAALPLGLALAWVLLKIVNVAAFGWQLPVFLYPAQWGALLALALVTAAVSAFLPALRLLRLPPRALLGVFANER